MIKKKKINNREVELIPVGSIREEKEYIKKLKCNECGGEYKMFQQTLLSEEKVDLLLIICQKCKKKRELYFDITKFFGKSHYFIDS